MRLLQSFEYVQMISRIALLLFGVIGVTSSAPALADSSRAWDEASGIGRDALVIAALGVPLLKKDADGALQAGCSISAAFVTTTGLKQAFPEWRPDRSDQRSFPSGHTSVSFAAAATLQNRYGWEIGAPAHVAAAFVGLARVQARKHDWDDVVVGAAIGEAAGLLITRKRDSKVIVVGHGDTSSGGIVIAMRF